MFAIEILKDEVRYLGPVIGERVIIWIDDGAGRRRKVEVPRKRFNDEWNSVWRRDDLLKAVTIHRSEIVQMPDCYGSVLK